MRRNDVPDDFRSDTDVDDASDAPARPQVHRDDRCGVPPEVTPGERSSTQSYEPRGGKTGPQPPHDSSQTCRESAFSATSRRLSAAVAAAARRLAAADVPSPRVDAELLAAFVLGTPRGRLVLVDGFTPDQYDRYTALVDRRAMRVPLQHLVGSAPFAGTEVAVGPGVFVPRPETELLVEWGLRTLATDSGPRPGGPVVVDLCAGSGAVALAVARSRPATTVYAVERDPQALRWLRRNAGDLVTVVAADVASPDLPRPLAGLAGQVDLVLANPPYIPDGTPLPPDVAGHDPATALYGGPDGLAVIRPMIATAAQLLRPGGGFATEHDDSHGDAVPTLLRADGRYADVADHTDLAGRPRFATARRV